MLDKNYGAMTRRNWPRGKRTPAGDKVNRWYSLKRWKVLRANQLRQHPFCQCPHHTGERVKATVVDHIEPHRGDTRLFWNPRNLQSLTKDCHDAWKHSQEYGGKGFLGGCDEHGNPLNKDHEWYKDD